MTDIESSPSAASENPYVGPKPFETREKELFFGRDWEAEELVALVVAHPVVLLYAQSGAGKSSLLNAEVLPRLETEENCEILPVARVRGDLPPGVQAELIDNLYVFNTLMSWSEKLETTPPELVDLSVVDFLRRLPRRGDEEGYPVLRVVVFDQFEELFTFYPERWPEREDFFRQVNEALADDAFLRVLFVIREEYLAQLDTFAELLPEQLRPRFRLERLDVDAALAAVEGPLNHTHRAFAPGVARGLVSELLKVRVEGAGGETIERPGRFVEPVQLQVVCQSLWAALPPEVTTITANNLEEFGDIDQALTRFYERAVDDTVHKTDGIPLMTEWRLRNWFEEELVTPAGTRGLVYRGSTKTGSVPNAAVDVLENHHIIRGERRAGARWYELTHDRLIEPLQKSNRSWRIATLKSLARIASTVIVAIILILIATGPVYNFVYLQATQLEQVQALLVLATRAVEEAVTARETAEAANASAQEAVTQAAAAAAEVQATTTAVAQNVRTERVRPLRAGLSIGGTDATAGTLGYFAVDETGQRYVISEADVLGNVVGGPILQPGPFDGGQIPADVIGQLATDPVPLSAAGSVANLTALGRLNSTVEIEAEVPNIGPIPGVREPQVGMNIRKLGRATGWTEGEIIAVDQPVSVTFDDEETVRLQGAAFVAIEATQGDAGALVVDEAGYAIGLLVIVNEGIVLVPVQDILDLFDVQLLDPSLAIQDMTAVLERHPDLTYPTRDLADIERIVIHHTATEPSVPVERIAEFAVNSNDLPGITYHYCVSDQGAVYQTQPLDVIPGQVGEFSNDSIDVCLIGDFTDDPPPLAQINAVAVLLAELSTEFDISVDDIEGRNELEPRNQSPGLTWPQWKESLLAKVAELRSREIPVTVATPTPTATPMPTPISTLAPEN